MKVQEIILESAAWRRKEGKSKAGGLNAKGVASYRRENPGSKLKTAVTTKPSKLNAGSKAAKRRKSFCARMGGVKGPMKKPNGEPTRKALALRKWNCHESIENTTNEGWKSKLAGAALAGAAAFGGGHAQSADLGMNTAKSELQTRASSSKQMVSPGTPEQAKLDPRYKTDPAFRKEVDAAMQIGVRENDQYQQGVAEGAPELLKAEMPLVRHVEQELADKGWQKGDDDYDKVFSSTIAMYRKFGNVDAINQVVTEGPSLPSTLKSITANGEPITQLYGKLKAMAKRWVDNNGSLKGFHRNAAGQSAQWFNNFYFDKLQNDLYALTKQAPKYAPPLISFLKDASESRERRINFIEISSSLPPILFKIGERIKDENLMQFARSWEARKDEYDLYLSQLESEVGGDDDFDYPGEKPEKSKVPGQQNAQAEQIVNNVLSNLPKNVAGEIRNAIARAPNKIQALHQELTKRNIQGVAEEIKPHSIKVEDIMMELRNKLKYDN